MGNSNLQGRLFRGVNLKFALKNSRTLSLNWHSPVEIGTRAILPNGQIGLVVDISMGDGSLAKIEFPDPAPITSEQHLRAFKSACFELGLLPWLQLFKLLPSALREYTNERLESNTNLTSFLDAKSSKVLSSLLGKSMSLRTLKGKLGEKHLNHLLSIGILKKTKTEPYRAREFSPTSTPPEGLSKSLSKLLALLESLGSATLSELNLRGFNANQVNALIKRGLIEEKSITPPKFTPLRSKFEKMVYSAPYSSLFERIYTLSKSVSGSLIVISQDKSLLKELANYLSQRVSKNILSITTDEKPENLYSNYFSAQAKNSIVLSQEAGFFLPAFSLEKIILLGSVDEPFFMLLSEKLCKELSIPLYYLDISSRLFFLKDSATFDLEEPHLLVVQRAPGEILTKKAKELIERDLNQRVLFLVSKSGYSYGYCKQCNSFAHCPVCQGLLTLSKDLSLAYCTSCGFSSEALCPECNSRLFPIGFGVQRLEEEVKILFPSSENFEFSTNPQKEGLYDLVIVASADPILSVPRFNSLFNYLDYVLKASRLSKSLTLVQTSEVSNPLLKGVSFFDMLKELLSEREQKFLPPFSAFVETNCQIRLPEEASVKIQKDRLYITIPRSHLASLMSALSNCSDVKLFLD